MSCELPELRMPPEQKEIYHPIEGWIENAYYLVEASFNVHNPVWRYIFFSGFLNNGKPGNYNQIVSKARDALEYKDAWYFKPLFALAYENEQGLLQDLDGIPETKVEKI